MKSSLSASLTAGLILFLLPAFYCSIAHAEARPFFEDKGDYRGKIEERRHKFKERYGYELVDVDADWRLEEIDLLDRAMAQLPPVFYRLRGVKGLYRVSYFPLGARDGIPADEVPAAVFPAVVTIYRADERSYNAYVDDDLLRVEFYSPLFSESEEDAVQIMHHELGHLFDLQRQMLSASREWLQLSRFRVLHVPALDAQPDSDFLYVFLNDVAAQNYAPVSTRQQLTYSRQNPQEDFANSVAAYIHYPYFQYTNPERYGFLRARVFDGRDYFPRAGQGGYHAAVLADLEKALADRRWDAVESVMRETGRLLDLELDKKTLALLRRTAESAAPDTAALLGRASCFMYHPEAVEWRRDLARKLKLPPNELLAGKRCFYMGRDFFEQQLAPLPPANVFYFRAGDRDYVQFLDPAQAAAAARGFETRYTWRLVAAAAESRILAEGKTEWKAGGVGAVRIDLRQTAEKERLELPPEELALKIIAYRRHPQDFKEFHSQAAEIRFAAHPWFRYETPSTPEIKVVYPLHLLFLEKKTGE